MILFGDPLTIPASVALVWPYWSWRVIPSPRLAASPLSSYSLPAGAVTHQAAEPGHTWAHILAPPRPRTSCGLRPPAPASSTPPPAPGRAKPGSSVTRRGLGGAFQRRCLYLQLRAAPRRATISWAARQPRQLAINIQPPAAGTLSCTSYFYTGTSSKVH